MQLIIVSGLSGSGKSIALSTLEDCGYYCVDNLPVRLIEAFVRDGNQNLGKTAISIDCRNLAGDVNLFEEALKTLKQFTIPYRILFLTAALDTLINRYRETRRKHPLSHTGLLLAEAIERERKLLEPIAAQADLLIDTTHTNIHQLRELVVKRLTEDHRQLALCFTSFGFKHGLPLDADFVFDARCLPNPHWEPELRPLTGRDPQVAAYLENLPETELFLSQVEAFLTTWLPQFGTQRGYLTIAIGCTGGRHRSVYLAEKLGQRFLGLYSVVVRHRELE
jgi:UPF0042 nucleotide-binding protein